MIFLHSWNKGPAPSFLDLMKSMVNTRNVKFHQKLKVASIWLMQCARFLLEWHCELALYLNKFDKKWIISYILVSTSIKFNMNSKEITKNFYWMRFLLFVNTISIMIGIIATLWAWLICAYVHLVWVRIRRSFYWTRFLLCHYNLYYCRNNDHFMSRKNLQLRFFPFGILPIQLAPVYIIFFTYDMLDNLFAMCMSFVLWGLRLDYQDNPWSYFKSF